MNSTEIQPGSYSILVADDDRFTRLMLQAALEEEGYQVVEACDGKECLKVYKRTQPDLVLMDAMMPEMDGFECCQQLLALPGSQHIPILMITGLDDRESVDRAFTVGATDYVTKPIHWPVLRQRVRLIIEKAQLYRDLEKANQELQYLASMDGLTRVSNRRSFDEYLETEWQRMAREQLPMSAILCDVDCFKTYNDTYGHQAGDRCLQQVAAAIRSSTKRPADLVARYGGEEFAVVLPNTTTDGAVSVVEDIQTELAQLQIPHAKSCANEYVTLSLGIASIIPHHKASTKLLISEADKALYKAKEEGRNTYRTVTL